jgi:hypothetical protein
LRYCQVTYLPLPYLISEDIIWLPLTTPWPKPWHWHFLRLLHYFFCGFYNIFLFGILLFLFWQLFILLPFSVLLGLIIISGIMINPNFSRFILISL